MSWLTFLGHVIDDWQSEPYHQHQDFAARVWADLKMLPNKLRNVFSSYFYEELGKFAPTQGYLISVQQECKSFLAVADLSSSTEIQ